MPSISETKTYVASNAIALFDVDPHPAENSVLNSLFLGNNITQGLIEDTINGNSHKLGHLYDYGVDEYTLGIPGGTVETIITDSTDITLYIESIEVDPVTVTSVLLERGAYNFFLQDYLVNTHGYNRFNARVTGVPPTIAETMDADKEVFLLEVDTLLQGRLTILSNSVPTDNEVRTATTHDGQSATEVVTTTYTQVDTLTSLPLDKRYSVLQSTELNAGEEGVYAYYVINLESVLKVHVQTNVNIKYSEKVETYYEYADSSVTATETVNKQAVVIQDATEVYSSLSTYPYQDSYIPDFNRSWPYYYVEYHTTDSVGNVKPKHLLYEDGVIPLPGYPKGVVGGDQQFYPVIVLRKDNVDLFSEPYESTDIYTSSKELLSKVNIDVLDLVEGVNASPDIDSIDHAFLVFGVGLTTGNAGGIRYLFEFFDHMSVLVQGSIPGNTNSTPEPDVTWGGLLSPLSSIHITEGGVDMTISWLEITTELVQGKKGNTGFVDLDVEIIDELDILHLYHQIDTNTYKHIRVVNPKHTNFVYKEHTVETRLRDILDQIDGEEDSNFVIPLYNNVVVGLPLFVQSSLFYVAPTLVFYSYEKVKLKWYQTSGFKAILSVVAITVFIVSGVDIYSALSVLISAGEYVAALTYLATIVAISTATTFVFKYLVQLLGEKFAFLLAIAAIIAAAFGEFSGFSELLTIYADDLLLMSINLSDAIVTNIQEELLEIKNAVALFEEEAADLMDELEQKKELLNTKSLLNPFTFVQTQPLLLLDESPTSFYNRTIHNINVGTTGFELVTNYVDLQLTLPTPTHTF
jgi:hypothetical protein